MIQTITVYTVTCDRCGRSADEGGDHIGWSEVSMARSSAQDSGYNNTGKTDYCPACVIEINAMMGGES